jgi:ArsR family transcriptional regulator, virulence genes transcriptional regulator
MYIGDRIKAMKQEIQMEVLKLQAELCKALADPKRLHIIKELREGERTVSELTKLLGLKQANTSQHLAVLRRIGLISFRKDGNTVYYRLTNAKIAEACDLVHEVIAEQLHNQQSLLRLM